MFRNGQQWSKVEELIASLEVLSEDAPECLVWVVPEVSALLDADKCLAFGVRDDEGRLSLSFAHARGLGLTSRLAPRFDELLRTGKHALLFDPARPESLQRNVAMVLPPVLGIPSTGVTASRGSRRIPIHLNPGEGLLDPECRRHWACLFAEAGIQRDFVLRTLICDGPALLAWIGVFLPKRPCERERKVLSSLVAPLQKRLKLEALVGTSSASAATLEIVLEKVAAPSFLIAAEGRIEYANSSGRALVDANPIGVLELLRESLQPNGADPTFDVTRLSSTGAPDHYLAVQRRGPELGASKLEGAVTRWRLRPQGARVLSELVQGDANKTIAAKLGCAESTIELHVTHILRQAGVESRAALIAKFWTTL